MWTLLRKLLVFVVGTGLTLGGLYLLGAELFLVHRTFWRIIVAGIMLTGMGGYLLWTDFIAAMAGVKSAE